MITDLLAWISAHPWTVVLVPSGFMLACWYALDRCLAYWEQQAELQQRARLERIMKASTPRAAGYPSKRVG